MTPPRPALTERLEARLRAEAEALRRLRDRLHVPLRATVAHIFGLLEQPSTEASITTAEPAPTTAEPTASRESGLVRAPTPFHDARAEPIRVRVAQGVVDRILGDAVDHLRGPRGDDETGWVPVGHVEGDVVVVEGLLPKGRNSRATPGEFEIDHGHVLAALSLAQTGQQVQVVGLVHTHPGRMNYNSSTDRASDELHVLTLPGGLGVYPIVVREPAAVTGHELSVGLRLAWWGMRSSRPGVYVPCEPEVVRGPDVTAWVAEHADALAEAGDALLELLERQLMAVLVPAPAGAVDLVATLSATSVVVRFDPEPVRVVLDAPSGRVPLACPRVRGRALGRRLAEVLTRPAESAAAGRHGAPEESPVRKTAPRASTQRPRSTARGDRTGRSRESTTKKQPRRRNS